MIISDAFGHYRPKRILPLQTIMQDQLVASLQMSRASNRRCLLAIAVMLLGSVNLWANDDNAYFSVTNQATLGLPVSSDLENQVLDHRTAPRERLPSFQREPTAKSTAVGTARKPRHESVSIRNVQISSNRPIANPLNNTPFPEVNTTTAKHLTDQAIKHLQISETKLRRGLQLTAKKAARTSLAFAAEAKDFLQPGTQATKALQQGLKALDAAKSITTQYGHSPANQTSTLSTSRIADTYFDNARRNLAIVAKGDPVAARALFVLAQIERQTKRNRNSGSESVIVNLLRASVEGNPRDSIVTNELGYELLQMGHLAEAEAVLQYSLEGSTTPAAIRNLAEVKRMLGKLQDAKQLIARIGPHSGPFNGTRMNQPTTYVTQVSPSDFAAMWPDGGFGSPASIRQASQVGIPPRYNNATYYTPTNVPNKKQGPISRVARLVSKLKAW